MQLFRIHRLLLTSFLLLFTVGLLNAEITLSEKEAQALQAQTQWALKLIRSNHYLKNEIQSILESCIDDNILGNEVKLLARRFIKKKIGLKPSTHIEIIRI